MMNQIMGKANDIILILYQNKALVGVTLITIVLATAICMIVYWWSLIRKQLQIIQNSTFVQYLNSSSRNTTVSNTNRNSHASKDPFRMIRCKQQYQQPDDAATTKSPKRNRSFLSSTANATTNTSNNSYIAKNINMLSLNPDFVQQYNQQTHQSDVPKLQLMSLGEYISSLRPNFTDNNNNSNDVLFFQIPEWFEMEIQAALAVILLQTIGPQMGMVILPTLGLSMIHQLIRKLVTKVSLYIPENNNDTTTTTLNDDSSTTMSLVDEIVTNEYSGIPLSIATMSTGAEIHYQQYKRNKKNNTKRNLHDGNKIKSMTTPLDLLRNGEVGYKLSFSQRYKNKESDTTNETTLPQDTFDDMIPNPFIMSEHWNKTIQKMEEYIIHDNHQYNPMSYEIFPQPKIIDDRFFPDLYIGWGNALCTHTQRQILYNRLLSILLNRLAYNYHISTTNTTSHETKTIHHVSLSSSYFVVQISLQVTESITRPCDFMKALLDCGHTITTCIQTQTTTFGMALCVKENVDDDNKTVMKWTNIPIAYFLQTGLTDSQGKESYVCLPHSGLNLEISSGPIIPDTISIQHYLAIEGLCGWHSNHCANVPWIRGIICDGSVRHNYDSIESIRIAGLQAIIINTVGTKYDLPYGGYGLTGVCNDSAAQLESAITLSNSGKGIGLTSTTTTARSTGTHIYPLTFHGKFAMHTLRVARELRRTLLLQSSSNSTTENVEKHMLNDTDNSTIIQSLDHLIQSIISLPSDTNTAPITDMIHQCERYLHCCGNYNKHDCGNCNNLHETSEITTATTTTITNDVGLPPAFQLLVDSCHIVQSIYDELNTITSVK